VLPSAKGTRLSGTCKVFCLHAAKGLVSHAGSFGMIPHAAFLRAMLQCLRQSADDYSSTLNWKPKVEDKEMPFCAVLFSVAKSIYALISTKKSGLHSVTQITSAVQSPCGVEGSARCWHSAT
jgi:hypothetical protein